MRKAVTDGISQSSERYGIFFFLEKVRKYDDDESSASIQNRLYMH
jgi:hypothetical protein